MNIILFDETELSDTGRVALGDHRFTHLQQVLKVQPDLTVLQDLPVPLVLKVPQVLLDPPDLPDPLDLLVRHHLLT